MQIVELLKKHRALECLTDVVKFYLVVSPNTESPLAMPPALSSSSHQCYQVLGILHSLWTPVPGSIKDYISTPKQNGYQGLHSSLITFGCSAVRSVEIIVHTLAMHQRADFGIAAERWPRALHDCRSSGSPSACFGGSAGGSRGGVWDPLGIRRMLSSVGVVRGGTNSVDSADGADRSVGRNVPAHGCERLERDAIARRVNWLQSIRQWQREFLSTVTAREFMQVMRQDLLSRTIFAFTPAGDILRLPKGATVVDFAYHVHTEVGNTMVSAKVNNVTVDASYELQNAGACPSRPNVALWLLWQISFTLEICACGQANAWTFRLCSIQRITCVSAWVVRLRLTSATGADWAARECRRRRDPSVRL
jgi:hypothetical protein